MEFIYQNYLNTTTAIDTASGSDTVQYLFDRNHNIKWQSVGFNDDTTSTTVTINFTETTTVDRIAILGTNVKQGRVFYNGVTANVFTPDINFTTNSDTSLYYQVSSVACTSVTFQMDSTIVANEEKTIGEFILSEVGVSFERNPNASSYSPLMKRESIDHKMSDGGIIQHIIADKFTAKIKYEFIGEDFLNSLTAFYNMNEPFYFAAFPTTTGWDAILYEVNWIGDFKLREYSSENIESGFNIEINLHETSN